VETNTSPKASRLGVLARAGTKVFVPLWFRAAHSDLQDHVSLNQTGWILAHCPLRSKRKMCQGQYQRSHSIHSFSTSTGIVQVRKNVWKMKQFEVNEKRFPAYCTKMVQSSLRKTREIF
jgi:hypothetical protein